jgi:EAL domain-containing protein (putative c-di-GMP-specific phosphodiesterase class I)
LLESFGVDCLQGYYLGEPQLEPDWKQNTVACALKSGFNL